ncbi:MAG: N-formylglutamate deformylase [Mariniblastus sp.]|jgi:N-formylglutamate deformylase
MKLFRFQKGYTPLVVSNPHSGTFLLPEIAELMTEAGLKKRDTDWFLTRVYDLPALESAAMLTANLSRYVVDLNRSGDGQSLYPGQWSTEICPKTTFDQEPIYREGCEPDEAEVAKRIEHYWQPYHDQLRAELERLVGQFGFAVLLDVHSIAQEVPTLFEGKLPDFNFGTSNGQSCGPEFQAMIEEHAAGINGFSHVVNGRFVGGHITRHYGGMENVHAVQLELNRSTYMDEETLEWEFMEAQEVIPVIEDFVVTLMKWAEARVSAS